MNYTRSALLATTATLAAVLTANAQPANNLCSGATPVVDGDNAITNMGATLDTPSLCIKGLAEYSIYDGPDVWYAYTAPATGLRNFEIVSYAGDTTGGAGGDTTLSIFDACGGAVLSCSDDEGRLYFSKVYHLPVTAGTTYLVRFSTLGEGISSPATAAAVLRIAAPPAPVAYDDCELATPIAGQPLTVPVSRAGLTRSDVQGWDLEYAADGWFAWTPSMTGIAVVDGCPAAGAGQARSLSIYDACGAAPLLYTGTFQDAPNPACFPKLCLQVSAGQTYIIRVLADQFGPAELHLDVRPLSGGISIPAGAVPEPGSCADPASSDINGGCAVGPAAFTPISLCTTYAGTASSRSTIVDRTNEPAVLQTDQDWYEFTLDADQTITVTGESEFPRFSRLMFGCPGTEIRRAAPAPAECAGTNNLGFTTGTLVAGTYYFVLSPEQGTGLTSARCGIGDKYWFRITGETPCPPACVADFNGQNGVDLLDIFAFLNAWFGGCTAPGPAPCVKSADVNAMNGVDLLDIFFFLNHWFGGC